MMLQRGKSWVWLNVFVRWPFVFFRRVPLHRHAYSINAVALFKWMKWLFFQSAVVCLNTDKIDLTLPLWSTKISLLTNLSMFPCWPSKGSRISWTAVSSSRLRQEKADDILLTQRWTRILPQPIWNHLHAVQLQPPLRRWRGQLQKGYIGCSLRSLCCLWHTWCSFSSSTTTEDFSALVDKFVSTKSE